MNMKNESAKFSQSPVRPFKKKNNVDLMKLLTELKRMFFKGLSYAIRPFTYP